MTTFTRRRADLRRSIVGDVAAEAGRTQLLPTDGSDPVVVPAVPRCADAHRWLGAMRRIDRVIVRVSPEEGARAEVHGVGHRLPTARPIPLGTALGLAELGVPLLVEEER